MPPPLTPEKRAEILALRKLPPGDISRKAGVSRAAVYKVLADSKPTKRRAPAPAPAPPSAKPAPAPEAAEPDERPAVDQLADVLVTLRRGTEACVAEGDWARVATIQRVVKDVTALVAKLTPPPPVDRETQPDTVAESDAAVTKLFARLETIIGQATK